MEHDNYFEQKMSYLNFKIFMTKKKPLYTIPQVLRGDGERTLHGFQRQLEHLKHTKTAIFDQFLPKSLKVNPTSETKFFSSKSS